MTNCNSGIIFGFWAIIVYVMAWSYLVHNMIPRKKNEIIIGIDHIFLLLRTWVSEGKAFCPRKADQRTFRWVFVKKQTGSLPQCSEFRPSWCAQSCHYTLSLSLMSRSRSLSVHKQLENRSSMAVHQIHSKPWSVVQILQIIQQEHKSNLSLWFWQ